uniref:Uncharacterized protein n=1 Tax=Arundo donax TaxID=35708 RepID=A0A0A9GEA9_ARUDO
MAVDVEINPIGLEDWEKLLHELLGVPVLADAPDGVVADDDLPRRIGLLQRGINILEDVCDVGLARSNPSSVVRPVLRVVPVLQDEGRRVDDEEVRSFCADNEGHHADPSAVELAKDGA